MFYNSQINEFHQQNLYVIRTIPGALHTVLWPQESPTMVDLMIKSDVLQIWKEFIKFFEFT